MGLIFAPGFNVESGYAPSPIATGDSLMACMEEILCIPAMSNSCPSSERQGAASILWSLIG